jgi:hypothetical protein
MTSSELERHLGELTDLIEEWDLTLGTVSDESRVVYRRSVTQFTRWLADAHPTVGSVGQIARRHSAGAVFAPMGTMHQPG